MRNQGWDTYVPRPQLWRGSCLLLNEGWTLDKKAIDLPWPPQAALSGWKGPVGEKLEYEKSFTLPQGFAAADRRVVLHFGAVDQIAEVKVNGRDAVRHEGGYLPFSADITPLLKEGENRLAVCAVDSLSLDYPYGKQSKRPHGMWYTPVSGIWQTVWLESVPARGAVSALRITPDLTGVTLEVEADGAEYTVCVPMEDGEDLRVTSREKRVRLDVPRPRLWTTEDPHLYHFTVTTAADRVESYFALRTVTVEKRGGFDRLCLNGEPVFLHGVLDQGYFPDGLFLPREPEEYERDILRMKELGFNTLRKHVKVEPEAFYYACDRLGMLVMQDMVNSGPYHYIGDTVVPTFICRKRPDRRPRRRSAREKFFVRHVRDTLKHLYNHPCIVGYTIFNEGWGQFDSDRICRGCKADDPTRFYVATSGWFAQQEGDVQSEHIYFKTVRLRARRPGKFLLLSECGGFTRRVPGHGSDGKKRYGYGKTTESEEALTRRIEGLYEEMVLPSIPDGLCGCIYTQLSDVEGEINGLYTYDRAVCKVDRQAMNDISRAVRDALNASTSK